jgi:hypothetical protein
VSTWVALADLSSLRAEFNELAPGRDKGADGMVGDAAHQAESSDHNPDDTAGSRTPHTDSDNIAEVHALDVDSSGPWPAGMTMAKAVAVVVARMKSMGSKAPLNYVIWDHHIYEHPGWAAATYSGTDPHTNHAHFSSAYGSGTGSSNPENYPGPWGLLEEFMTLSADDKTWISGQIKAAVDDFLTVKIGDVAYPNRTVGDVLRDTAKLRGVLVGDQADTDNAALKSSAPLALIIAAATPAPPEATTKA